MENEGTRPGVKIAYFDDIHLELENIIATNSNITCTFNRNTPPEFFSLVGQRAPDSLGVKGFRTGIPSWMVSGIDSNCSITVPSAFNTVTRDIIHAGAQVANFERMQRHFYTLGACVCGLLSSTMEARAIASAMLVAFTQRIGWLLRRCVDTIGKPTQMDVTERRLFRIGQHAEHDILTWWRGEEERSNRKRPHFL